MCSRIFASLSLVGASIVAADTLWPFQYSSLEDLVYLQSGYRKGAFGDLATPCGFTQNRVGRQTAAEWIRVAFHDTITHNQQAGTGGLDGSILFEIDRPENLGAAFNNTFADVAELFDNRTSLADLLATALVVGAGNCGEMDIPLRAGRIDAKNAGPAGVPEATTDVNTTMKRFATAGFSQSDGIGLIACGHTVGGVHSNEHPEIVTTSTPSPDNKPTFDTTSDAFDNKVVTEYLDGSTQNPLVITSNITQRSDFRAFSSDGNQTMKSLKDPAYFKSQCANLFERLINTVPSTVTLTDPITPNDIKPYVDTLQVTANGSIALSGSIRVRMTNLTGTDQHDLTVSLNPKSRKGASIASIATVPATFQDGIGSGHGESFMFYEFNQLLDPSVGISSFTVTVTRHSTKKSTTYDNAGSGGYPVSAEILYQLRQSCAVISGTGANTTAAFTITAAVPDDKDTSIVPVAYFNHRVPRKNSMIPKLLQRQYHMIKAGKKNGFEFWQANINLADLGSLATTFDLTLGNATVGYLSTNPITDAVCDVI